MEKKQRLTLDDIGSFLAKLAERSESVYWLSSPDFKKIQYLSPAYEKIWGRPRDILYTEPELWITYLHPDDVRDYHPIHAMADRVAKEGPTARYQESYRIIRPDGEVRWIIDQGFPIYDEKGICCGVTGIAVDITKDKLGEEALRKAKEEAEAANKAKTEFLENMRHDIRTPLAGIIGFADILGEEADNPKIKEYAGNLIASSNALMELLNEILDALKVTSGEVPLLRTKFTLKQKLNDIIKLNLARAKQKKLELCLDYDVSIPTYFIGDPKRIQRIILELVANALNFTNEGSVKVIAKLAKKKNHETIIKITVKDTGIGIPKDKQQEVFTRFKRLTPSYQGIYKGTGLGLSVVKQFIDDLNGEIYVESDLNKGTSFTCVLPLTESLLDDSLGVDEISDEEIKKQTTKSISVESTEPKVKESTQQTEKKPTHLSQVLLIEDQLIAAKVAEHILLALDCHVDLAENGTKALDLTQNKHYDIIFMDVGLPDISGYDVTKRIRLKEWNKEIPVPIIALTAHVDSENKQHCIEIGMNAVLSKPLTKDVANDILNAFVPTRIKPEESIEEKPIGETNKETAFFEITGEIIDMKKGLELSGGDEDLYKEMLQMMINSLSEEKKIMADAYEKKEWEILHKTAHKVKGGAVYCAANRLADACEKLDNYIRTGAIDLIPKLYQQFLKEEKKLQDHYKNLV